MFFVVLFLLITYLFCSFQFLEFFVKQKKHCVYIEKLINNTIKLIKKININPSVEDICVVFDGLKCCVFVIISAYLFHSKNIMDITAIVAYLGHRFPIYYKFKNESKNFISMILVGFILDPITGISMIVAFILSSRICEYTSVATISAMLAGIVKTLIHFSFFENNYYFENLFFIFFSILAISKNKRAMLYVIAKTSFDEDSSGKKRNKLETIKKDVCAIHHFFKKLKYSEKTNKNNELKYKKKAEKIKELKKYKKEENNKNKKTEYKNSNVIKKQKKYKMLYK